MQFITAYVVTPRPPYRKRWASTEDYLKVAWMGLLLIPERRENSVVDKRNRGGVLLERRLWKAGTQGRCCGSFSFSFDLVTVKSSGGIVNQVFSQQNAWKQPSFAASRARAKTTMVAVESPRRSSLASRFVEDILPTPPSLVRTDLAEVLGLAARCVVCRCRLRGQTLQQTKL